MGRGGLGQLSEQDRPDPSTLEFVGHREADLGAPAVCPDVLGTTDHPSLIPPVEDEQGQMVVEIDVDDLAGESSDVDSLRPEAQAARLG